MPRKRPVQGDFHVGLEWFVLTRKHKKTTLTTYLVNSSTLNRFTFVKFPKSLRKRMMPSIFKVSNCQWFRVNIPKQQRWSNHQHPVMCKFLEDLQSSVFLGSENTPPQPYPSPPSPKEQAPPALNSTVKRGTSTPPHFREEGFIEASGNSQSAWSNQSHWHPKKILLNLDLNRNSVLTFEKRLAVSFCWRCRTLCTQIPAKRNPISLFVSWGTWANKNSF